MSSFMGCLGGKIELKTVIFNLEYFLLSCMWWANEAKDR